MPRGPTQHHFQPGLRQRSHWHPTTLPIPTPSHSWTGRGHQMASPFGHHRVHAPLGWSIGSRILRWQIERALHDLVDRSRLRHPRSRYQQPQEISGEIWYRLGPTNHHPQGDSSFQFISILSCIFNSTFSFRLRTILKVKFFCPKIQFWQNPNIFKSFSPKFFWQFFSWNQSCQQLKSPKPQHFHEFFTKK